MTSFMEKLKKLRTAAGYSQAYLAEIIGVSAQSISNWECGNSMPDISQIVPLAGALAVSTDFLLDVGMNEAQDYEALKKHVDTVFATYSVNTVLHNADLLAVDLYKDFLRKYPMNYEVKYKCALAMHDYLTVGKKRKKFEISPSDEKTIFDDCRKLLVSICENSTETEHVINARNLLVQHLILDSKYEEAINEAAKLPSLSGLMHTALSSIYHDKGAYGKALSEATAASEEICYEYLMSIFMIAYNSSGSEKINILREAEIMARQAIELFLPRCDLGVNEYQSMPYCYLITSFSMRANEYLKMNRCDAALDCLKAAVDTACEMIIWCKANCKSNEVLSDYIFFAKGVPHWCFSYSGVFSSEENVFTSSGVYQSCLLKVQKAIESV